MRPNGKFLVAAPPDGRALWLRHDGSSINLMASTCFISAGLVLPVDDCFEVQILRVDRTTKCLYVKPLYGDDQYDELNRSLSAAAADDTKDSCRPTVSQPLSMSTVYMLRTEKGYLRAVLLKREKAMSFSMYGIDFGEVYDISTNDVYELIPSLRNIPPLCLRIILESCCNTSKCDEFKLLEEGAICIIKICNEFPSNYPQRAKEMYPPAIVSQIYRKSENGKFVEITCTAKVIHKIPEVALTLDKAEFSGSIGSDVANAPVISESVASSKTFFKTASINISGAANNGMARCQCRALVVKSASLQAINRDPALPFMFRKFSVLLPSRLIARITERTEYDTYLMRIPEALDDLAKRMVTATTPLKSRLCLDRGVCCVARLIRPARSNSSSFHPQIFRAIASHYRPGDNTCEVLLVDFGQTIVCSVSNLFELQDQPVEVLEKPIASFRCRVKKFSPSEKIGNKGVRLLDENDYHVCLTLKCAHDLYWAKVTLSDTDFVLYYKKPRLRKEEDEKKNMKERINNEPPLRNIKTVLKTDVMKKLEQREEKLHEEEKRLHELEELLKKEEENFTSESMKREQQLQLIALQMQLWDISAKLDMVTSNNSSFLKSNAFCAKMQQDNYCDVPMSLKKGCGQARNNGNSSTSMPQQQRDVAVNQSLGQQWARHHPTLSVVPPINPCSRPYQEMNGIRLLMPSITNAQQSFRRKWYSPPKKWQIKSPKKARVLLLNDTSSESNTGNSTRQPLPHTGRFQSLSRLNSKIRKRRSKTTLPTLKTNFIISNSCADRKISLSAVSFWDSCHRKLEYGEPPQRTISDYCNIAKKQPNGEDVQDNFSKRSLSATLQYTENLPNFSNPQTFQPKLENPPEAFGDAEASDSSHTSLNKRPIYTSDESADYSQLCISSSSYEEQEMLVLPELQMPLHKDDELQSLPTYQIYHKLVSIVNGSELIVRRVGSSADWPVFFVIPITASQTAACFDSLYPTQKLNVVGALCVVQCNDLGGIKVRALIEHFSENTVHVRHIDDGHVQNIQPNKLWSIENLSPSVRNQPALAVPCILASFNEAHRFKTIKCYSNEIPSVGQLMRALFKEQRDSDGIWIVEINEM